MVADTSDAWPDPRSPAQEDVFGLHHVQLAMPPGGEQRARSFFGDLLGMEEIAKPAELAKRGGVWFRGGELELHLGVEQDFSAAMKAHPGILTDALDDVAARLDEAGYDVRFDDDFPGFRRFYTRDCFGNRLEFLEPADDLDD